MDIITIEDMLLIGMFGLIGLGFTLALVADVCERVYARIMNTLTSTNIEEGEYHHVTKE